VSFRAYAKINLGLLVLEKRPDGYHTIETVFHRVGLFDEISLDAAPDIVVESSSPNAPGDERNICFKAARLLQAQLKIRSGVKISIQKNIPVGAGLGGGSSDAAAVLLHLPAFWSRTVGEQQLSSLAIQLGSDVPYFLKAGSAHARGRGEILTHVPLDIPYSILLCNPGIHVSTAWAYQRVTSRNRSADLATIVRKGMNDPKCLQEIENDFESTVLEAYPVVREVKRIMMDNGATFSLMTGSGSTVFGLYAGIERAEQTSHVLEARGFQVHVTPPHFNPD
jgi:4-diphosphocytidyl-2-C-methyl-D-erythritol kinase